MTHPRPADEPDVRLADEPADDEPDRAHRPEAAPADGDGAADAGDADTAEAAPPDADTADDAGAGNQGAAGDGQPGGDETAMAEPDWDALATEDERSPGQLLAALRETERQRDEWLDDLRRKQAEFDNFRKRMMREANSQRIIGHGDVAERLLDVLDDFDRTVAATRADEGLQRGVVLVRDKLMAILSDFGLQRIDEPDVPFDPNRHEAVQQVDGEADEPVVAQVLRPGYALNDRVLRAAMVVVAQ